MFFVSCINIQDLPTQEASSVHSQSFFFIKTKLARTTRVSIEGNRGAFFKCKAPL